MMRQTHRHTEKRQTDRDGDRQTEMETDKQRQRETDRLETLTATPVEAPVTVEINACARVRVVRGYRQRAPVLPPQTKLQNVNTFKLVKFTTVNFTKL